MKFYQLKEKKKSGAKVKDGAFKTLKIKKM